MGDFDQSDHLSKILMKITCTTFTLYENNLHFSFFLLNFKEWLDKIYLTAFISNHIQIHTNI